VFLFLLPENCFLVPLQLEMGFYTNGFWRLTGALLSRSQRSVLAGVQSLHFPPLFPRPVPLFHDFRLIFRSQLLLPLLHLHLFTTTTRLVPCVCMCVCWACGCVCVWAGKILIHFSDFRFCVYFCASGGVGPLLLDLFYAPLSCYQAAALLFIRFHGIFNGFKDF